MANVLAPNGFQAVRRLDGASWTGNLTAVKIAANNAHNFFWGDPVSRLNTGYIDIVQPGSLPTQGVLGIFAGYRLVPPVSSQAVSNYYPASSTTNDVEAYIIDDPLVVLRAWVGTGSAATAGGPLTQTYIGNTFNFSYGAGGSSLSGISSAYIDFSTASTTNTLPFTCIGLVTTPPGVNGTDIATAGNIGEFTFNQQAYRVGTTGV